MRTDDLFTLRDATEADLPAVRQTLTEAILPYRDTAPADFLDAYLAMALDLEARRSSSELIVVTDRDRVVGTVTFFPSARLEGPVWRLPENVAGLRSMAVHPGAHGSGAADALFEECVRRARAAGATAITLHTGPFMAGAMRFYERVGFRRDPDHDLPASEVLGITEPTVEMTALAYRLDLA